MSAVASPARLPAARGTHAPRTQPGHGRPRLRLVEPPRHTKRWVALLVGTAAAGIFFTVGLNALAAESAFEARALEQDIEGLTLAHQALVAEVAALESPERIRRIAMQELGMVPAESPTFLVAENAQVEDPDAPDVSQSPTPVAAIGR